MCVFEYQRRPGGRMSDLDVRELFLRAITDNDSAAMHEGLQRLLVSTLFESSPWALFEK